MVCETGNAAGRAWCSRVIFMAVTMMPLFLVSPSAQIKCKRTGFCCHFCYRVVMPVKTLYPYQTDIPTPLSTICRLDLRVPMTFGKPEEAGGEVALVVQNAFQDNYAEYGAVTQTAGKIFFDRRA